MNPNAYTYVVRYSPEDEEYVATIEEFASLSWLDPTPDGALNGAIALVAQVVEDMRENGERIPEPLGEREDLRQFVFGIQLDLNGAFNSDNIAPIAASPRSLRARAVRHEPVVNPEETPSHTHALYGCIHCVPFYSEAPLMQPNFPWHIQGSNWFVADHEK